MTSKKSIWFMKGFTNLFHAINDIKNSDVDHEFSVLCSHSNSYFMGFEAADFIEKEPTFKNEAQFVKYCLEIIKKHNVSVIFAHHHQNWLNNNKELFKEVGAEVATVASSININKINNKRKFYSLAKKLPGLNIFEFNSFKTLEEYNKHYSFMKKQGHELCIKPCYGVYGSDFYKLKGKQYNSKVVASALSRNNEMLLMQYLEGTERSVDCIAYHGKLVGMVIRVKHQNSLVPQTIEYNPNIEKQVKILVESLNLNGMFNVQFKDMKGEHFVLEINPRLAGRSFYSTLAGLNIPYIAACLFSNTKTVEEIEYNIAYGMKIGNVSAGVVMTNNFAYESVNNILNSNERQSA